MLTPDFGKVQKASKMASSERVFSMKSFRSPSGITLMFKSSTWDGIVGAPSAFQPITPSRRPRMK